MTTSARSQAGPGLRITTAITAEQQIVDTRGRLASDNGLEAITRAAPTLRVAGRSAGIQASLDYTANLIHRAGRRASQGGELQNALNASFLAEAVRGLAFLEAQAGISQQSRSASGRPAGFSATENANRAEVRTLTVAPFLRGELAGAVRYDARLSGTITDSSAAGASNGADSKSATALLSFGSARAGVLGWNAFLQRQRVSFAGTARPTETDRANLSLSARPDPDLLLSVNGGLERTDYGGAIDREFDNYGASLRWTPSPRTLVELGADERYFGRGFRVALQYRTPRTVWRYNDVRDVNNGSDGLGVGQPVTLYQLLSQQIGGRVPDPVQRDLLVLDLLRQLGRDPNEQVAGGVLAQGTTLQRRQDLAIAWTAPRQTVALQAFRTATRRVVDPAQAAATLNPDTRQTGYSMSVSHRLTPTAAIALDGSRQMTPAVGAQASADAKSAGVSYTDQIGRRASAGLRAGYRVFNSRTDPSRETTLSGSLSLQF